MRAWLNLRYTVPQRRAAFCSGLKRLGYEVVESLPTRIERGDIFVTWNRMGMADQIANSCIKHEHPVIVTENASWGNEFAGEHWYTLARSYHNTAGMFAVGGQERFDSLDVELAPFRKFGDSVILPQRGIGSPPTAMPKGWVQKAQKRYRRARTRKHPGRLAPAKTLEEDLADTCRVITWGSGAAIKALSMGIHVESEMPDWIGRQDNTEQGRLDMFRRLAWAQWRLSEIESGEAFAHLI